MGFTPDLEFAGRIAAECDFRPIHLKHARVAAGRAASRGDAGAGEETKFHEAAGIFGGKVDAVEHRGISLTEIEEGSQRGLDQAAVATELQHGFSMRQS